ncbi:hypothetical protein ACXY7D_12045 [Sphingomonas melonis]
MALSEIQAIVFDRGSKIARTDLEDILVAAVDVPLEDSEALGSVFGAIQLIVSDPLYEGDIRLSDLDDSLVG